MLLNNWDSVAPDRYIHRSGWSIRKPEGINHWFIYDHNGALICSSQARCDKPEAVMQRAVRLMYNVDGRISPYIRHMHKSDQFVRLWNSGESLHSISKKMKIANPSVKSLRDYLMVLGRITQRDVVAQRFNKTIRVLSRSYLRHQRTLRRGDIGRVLRRIESDERKTRTLVIRLKLVRRGAFGESPFSWHAGGRQQSPP